MSDQLRHDKIKAIGDVVEKFLELRPEYTGSFWNQYEFAEHLLKKVEEIEQEEFNKWCEVQETYMKEPF